MKTTYKATGLVLGNYWGGGKGSYEARPLRNDDREALLKEAHELLKTGGLDNGMGYESLIGALLDIETITFAEIDGKTFTHADNELVFIGDLTEEQQEFLERVYFNS
jgi:hypothetical protein